MSLSASPARATSIEIYGLIGMFAVPDKNVRVGFFSTLANSAESSGLLRELMPMRERVSPSAMRDLNALLQRDLNDARVAHELVPYLKGQTSSAISFFPAILAALLPKGFLEDGAPYPSPETLAPASDASPNRQVRFGDGWDVEWYQIDGQEVPLGKLTLYPEHTAIVVLDGQHRANAFRFVAGVFGQGGDFYSAFYQTSTAPETFDADLPVTLIWFESDAEAVQPDLVARSLFVDVNTNARPVNRSRNVLLDDRCVSSLVARFFLSAAAQNPVSPFAAGRFSLLHSGFDLDSDITSGTGHRLTLTNPDILDYVASWLLFGGRTFNQETCYEVKRERDRTASSEFAEVFGDHGFTGADVVIHDHTMALRSLVGADDETEMERIKRFEHAYRAALHPVFSRIFNDFALYDLHIQACAQTETWCRKTVAHGEVWDKVFAGGEGLYYAIHYYDKDGRAAGDQMSGYLQASDEIEKRFAELRAASIHPSAEEPESWASRVTKAYASMRTKAFQVGLFMAFDEWRDDEAPADVAEAFVERLNTRSASAWIYLMTDLKQALDFNVDPKKWPSYQKLVLRSIQDGEKTFYHEGNFSSAPDGRIFKKLVLKSFGAWVEVEGPDFRTLIFDDVPKEFVAKWSVDAKAEVDALLTRSEIEPIPVDPIAWGRRVIHQRVVELNEKG